LKSSPGNSALSGREREIEGESEKSVNNSEEGKQTTKLRLVKERLINLMQSLLKN